MIPVVQRIAHADATGNRKRGIPGFMRVTVPKFVPGAGFKAAVDPKAAKRKAEKAAAKLAAKAPAKKAAAKRAKQ